MEHHGGVLLLPLLALCRMRLHVQVGRGKPNADPLVGAGALRKLDHRAGILHRVDVHAVVRLETPLVVLVLHLLLCLHVAPERHDVALRQSSSRHQLLTEFGMWDRGDGGVAFVAALLAVRDVGRHVWLHAIGAVEIAPHAQPRFEVVLPTFAQVFGVFSRSKRRHSVPIVDLRIRLAFLLLPTLSGGRDLGCLFFASGIVHTFPSSWGRSLCASSTPGCRERRPLLKCLASLPLSRSCGCAGIVLSASG
mmetsp:Transcript_2199/g.5169  ORF Transcript_2199/g.5169 Transcript_2199/m.5169 type:complete len:250 (+) Transcript_2199:1202-1951(+)